jgi:AcrR family transcriptional regulator
LKADVQQGERMEEDRAGIKDRILQTATVLFAEKSFEGISMDELAKAANVNKSMIYYYFSSKDGLLIYLIQKQIAEFESLFNTIEIKKSSNISAFAKEVIRLAIDYISKNKNAMTILMQETMLKTPKTRIDIINFINPLWDKMENIIKTTFSGTAEASIMDKMFCVALITNFIMIVNRIDTEDEEHLAKLREEYVERVTDIIVSILIGKKHKA